MLLRLMAAFGAELAYWGLPPNWR